MAFGMKHWLGVVGVGVALVSIMSLPPASFERPAFKLKRLPEEVRLAALQMKVDRLNATLRIDHYTATFVPATVSAPDGLIIQGPAGVDDKSLSAVRTRIHDELASGGVTTRDVSLGVFFVHPSEGTDAEAPGGYLWTVEYYWGSRAGRPYCFTVVPLGTSGRIMPASPFLPSPSVLGVCELIAKYGLPGPTIERWLGNGGDALAATATPSNEADRAFTRTQYEMLFSAGFGRGVYFPGGPSSLAVMRCWSRIGAGCAEFIQSPPEVYYRTEAQRARAFYLVGHTALSAVRHRAPFDPTSAHVAADLSEQFGDASFAAFWKSDKPFTQAFESAFGTSLPKWSVEYLSAVLPMRTAGPNVTLDARISTILLLALSAIIGGVWASTRRVA